MRSSIGAFSNPTGLFDKRINPFWEQIERVNELLPQIAHVSYYLESLFNLDRNLTLLADQNVDHHILKDFTMFQGASAYELALTTGFEGNLNQWLQSLHGLNGRDGRDSPFTQEILQSLETDIIDTNTAISNIAGSVLENTNRFSDFTLREDFHSFTHSLDPLIAALEDDLINKVNFLSDNRITLEDINSIASNIATTTSATLEAAIAQNSTRLNTADNILDLLRTDFDSFSSNFATFVTQTAGDVSRITALEAVSGTHTNSIVEIETASNRFAEIQTILQAQSLTHQANISDLQSVSSDTVEQVNILQVANNTNFSTISNLQTVTAEQANNILLLSTSNETLENTVSNLASTSLEQSSLISQLTTTSDETVSSVTQLLSTQENLASLTSNLSTEISNASSNISNVQTTIADQAVLLGNLSEVQSTLASTIENLNSSVENANSSISIVQTTQANIQTNIDSLELTQNSQSSIITNLSSSVQNNFSSIQATISSIDGISNQYAIKINNNGRVSGFGLASTPSEFNDSSDSEFTVLADRFKIVSENDNGEVITPFLVTGSSFNNNGEIVPPGVHINDAYIRNGSIVNAKIGDAAIDSAKIKNASILNAAIANAAITSAKIRDAAITAAKIQSAAITNAKIANAAITSAKIGNLAVESINIAGGAVSESAFASQTGSSASVTHSTRSGTVLLYAILYPIGLTQRTVTLRRSGLVLRTFSISQTPVIMIMYVDNPNTSTHTYTVSGDGGAFHRTELLLLEVVK